MKLFLSHSLYGVKDWHYFHAYMTAPGWAFIHAGSWTLEVDWDPKGLLAPCLPKFITNTDTVKDVIHHEDSLLPKA